MKKEKTTQKKNKPNVSKCGLMAIALLFISTPAFADIPVNKAGDKTELTMSTGYNYSSGSYGQSIHTNVTYIPVTAKLKHGRWTAKLTVPYISITGPGNIVGDDSTVVGAAGIKRTAGGLGDVITSLGYAVPLGNQGTSADLTGKIKFPTADKNKGLGTGATDYTLQTGLTQVIGKGFVTGGIGRKFNGSSRTFHPRDVWKYTVAAGYNVTPEITGGAIYDFRQGSTSTSSDLSQIAEFINYKLTADWSAQAYTAQGLTNGAPKYSYGVQLSYKFDVLGS